MKKAISSALLKLKSKKFCWRIPPRVPLVVYHNGSYQRELGSFINKYKHICYNRTDVEILLPILLLSILVRPFRRACSLLDGYIDAFLWVAKCSVVLTVKDNDTTFYSISARNNRIKTIIIQNGVRNFHYDVFGRLCSDLSRETVFHVDYAFVFGSSVASLYEDRLGCAAIPIGCYKANARLPRALHDNHSSKSILFISNYAPKEDSSVFPSQFNSAIGIAFKSACKWAYEKGLSISVLSRCKASSRQRIIQEEYSFYAQSSMGIPFEVINSRSHEESYSLIESSLLNIGVDSTLCYESMQLGCRTIFLSVRGSLLNLEDWRYGWPASLPESGPFWTNSTDYSDHCKVLEFGFSSSDEDWRIALDKYFWGSVMSTSPQNIAIEKVLEDLLSSHDA